MDFAERLIQYREAHNLTQEALAERLGISRRMLYKYEAQNQYVALFNVTDWQDDFAVDFAALELEGTYKLRNLWENKDLGEVSDRLVVSIKSHDAKLYKLTKA